MLTTEKHERRARPRTTEESRATGLVQAILNNPRRAATELERDLRGGADWNVIIALLSAAEMLGRLRGLDLTVAIAFIHEHLRASRPMP